VPDHPVMLPASANDGISATTTLQQLRICSINSNRVDVGSISATLPDFFHDFRMEFWHYGADSY
jgi:hypothetical protein